MRIPDLYFIYENSHKWPVMFERGEEEQLEYKAEMRQEFLALCTFPE